MNMPDLPDLGLELRDHVATLEIRRPPHNFFDKALVHQIADACAALDADPDCRAIVLCSAGKNFCAGADFSNRSGRDNVAADLYAQAVRIFSATTPMVAAIQGAAIGGGLGLAVAADFRIAAPEARFSANFTQLGFHPGFGLTHTLPRLLGQQQASLMFLTGRRIDGEEAARIGLVDALAPLDSLRETAHALAREIAANAPLAVASTRATLRQGLAAAVQAAVEHELAEQTRLFGTEDCREGLRAAGARRAPVFTGR
ncbi:MAG: enoyl-CoA hydratase/isomerase family protein [Pseudodonghicola sp.]